jgi:hypothetical protein
MHDWTPLRVAANLLDARFNRAEELFSKTRALPLVPCLRLVEVGGGLRRKSEFNGHSGCGFSA